MVAVIIVLTAACQRLPITTNSEVMNQEIKNESGQIILAGKASPAVMQQPNYKTWYDQSYNSYQLDALTIQEISPLLKNKHIEIFLGSWCGDSKREVPRMLKILNNAGVDTTKLSLIFVDNSTAKYKQSPQHEEIGKNIHRVPTFIFFDGKKEIGRIVESPIMSLEKDMLAILEKRKYQPNYQTVSYWLENVKSRKKNMSDEELKNILPDIQQKPTHYHELNTYGYVKLAANETNEAVNVFKLNTMLYPNEAGVFDSLGEALTKIGNKQAAIIAYEKVLTLQPMDTNAKNALVKLKK